MTDIRFDRNHAGGTLACCPTVCLTRLDRQTRSVALLTEGILTLSLLVADPLTHRRKTRKTM